KVKVTDNVQDFVARQLFLVTQVGIDNLVVVDENTVAESPAVDQTHFFQFLDIAHEAKGPGRSDLVFERFRTAIEVAVFLFSYRFGIVENIAYAERFPGLNSDPLAPFHLNAVALIDDNLRPVAFLLLDARLFNELAKFQRRAVQNRD